MAYPQFSGSNEGGSFQFHISHGVEWIRRILVDPVPRGPLVQHESPTPLSEEQVDELVHQTRNRKEISPSQEQAVENNRLPRQRKGNIVHLRRPLGTNFGGNELSGQMRVIVVASQKGGSGKTTIAGHLAVQAGLAGHGPALLIDTDPQGSLAEWWRARKSDAPALAKVKLDEIEDNLAELRSYGTATIIIDTPPALTQSIERAMAIADLVVIPARPSPHDLRAIAATVEMCRRAGKAFVFVLNGAAQRANITVQAAAALSEHGRVAPAILHQRTEYAASMIDGRTVIEAAPRSKSAQEIAELWKFVRAQIGLRQAA
jgi:chromosome partitioning protein